MRLVVPPWVCRLALREAAQRLDEHSTPVPSIGAAVYSHLALYASPINECRIVNVSHLHTFVRHRQHKGFKTKQLSHACLCVSGAIAVGAAPDSPAFPSVSLAALILTARTALWQTSAGTRCLLRGETAGQWQQEAERHRHACSLLHPTVSLVVFFQRSLCEADAFSYTFQRDWLRGSGSFRSCFYRISTTIIQPQSLWRYFLYFSPLQPMDILLWSVQDSQTDMCMFSVWDFSLTDVYVPLDFS